LKVADVQARLGEWHEEHVVPKWFAGDEWHDAQPLLLGCVNAQLAPGLRWHVEH
jgi:hypothetical protein